MTEQTNLNLYSENEFLYDTCSHLRMMEPEQEAEQEAEKATYDDFERLAADVLPNHRPRRRLAYLVQRAIQRMAVVSDRVEHCGQKLVPAWIKGDWLGADFRLREDGHADGHAQTTSRMTASVSGIETCASVWACPICRTKICQGRRTELTHLEKRWMPYGDTVMVTLTVPHSIDQILDNVKGYTGRTKGSNQTPSGVLGAWSYMTKGRPWKEFCRRWGVEATVRALEVTYGQNGWHVHLHAEIFCAFLGAAACDAIKAQLHELWARALCAVGVDGELSWQHGVNVIQGDGLGSYLVKWGVPAELTGYGSKSAKNGNFSMAQVEAIFSGETESMTLTRGDALDLLEEYYISMHGNRHLTWGGNKEFREKLKVPILDDAALSSESDGILIATCGPALWSEIQMLPGGIADTKSALELGGYEFARWFIEQKLRLPGEQFFSVN